MSESPTPTPFACQISARPCPADCGHAQCRATPAPAQAGALTAERLAEIRHFLSLAAGCWHSPEYAEQAIQDLLCACDNQTARAATLGAQVRELRERNAMLGGALDDERRDSAAVVTEFRELRSKLTSLFEDFSNGCLPALGERGKATTPYWLAVNSERARNLEWAQLKCKELGIAWPIRPIPYGGIPAAPEQPTQPAPQGGGRVGVLCDECGGRTNRAHPYSGCQKCRALAREGEGNV